jgi:hypothetical protein
MIFMKKTNQILMLNKIAFAVDVFLTFGADVTRALVFSDDFGSSGLNSGNWWQPEGSGGGYMNLSSGRLAFPK